MIARLKKLLFNNQAPQHFLSNLLGKNKKKTINTNILGAKKDKEEKALEDEKKDLLSKIRKIQIQFKKRSQNIQAGQYLSHFKGRGIDFNEVRQYIPGDEVKNIDWNVTARMNTPHIKVFREEKEFEALIALDVSSSQEYGLSISKKNAGLAIAASLSYSAEQNSDRIAFLAFTSNVVYFTPPKKKNLLFPFIDFCLRCPHNLSERLPNTNKTNTRNTTNDEKHKNSSNTTSLSASLKSLQRILSKRSLIFFISDFIDEGDWQEEIAHISKKHEVVAIHLYDPSEHQLPNVGLVWLEDAESGAKQLVNTSSKKIRAQYEHIFESKNKNHSKIMERHGVDQITLNITEDYLSNLDRFLRTRKKKFYTLGRAI